MPDLNQRIWETSVITARANTEASSRAFISGHNEDLRQIYLSDVFRPWADSVRAGKTTNDNPPRPPRAYELAAPDEFGFVWPIVGSEPVCAIPAVPPNASTNVTIIPEPEDVRNVSPGDTMPVGFTVTDPVTRITWRKESSPTPFGTAYYYARVKS